MIFNFNVSTHPFHRRLHAVKSAKAPIITCHLVVTMCTPNSRICEIKSSLAAIINRISIAASGSPPPTLVAVSKYKPCSDIAAAYDAGQRTFGENYASELLEKVPLLPSDIQWHFIGHLQSNKAKAVASIPNLHTLHTLTSTKLATALDKTRAAAFPSSSPLNVLLQVNTSGEDTKYGLPPIIAAANHASSSLDSIPSDVHGLLALARYVIMSCPNLRLIGLMTIGSFQNSITSGDENRDFQTLVRTRDALQDDLTRHFGDDGNEPPRWGDQNGGLVLSMGMSSDFEAAIRAGSGIVRVGTSIFGERQVKNTDAVTIS